MCPDLPHVSFVIPVRDDARRLRACINSIRRAQYDGPPIEILVADNGSTDDTAAVARQAGARVLSLPGISVAEVRNRATQEASGSVLAFVDADHELDPGWIRAAVESLASPAIVAAGAPYNPPADGTWVQRMYDSLRQHSSSTSAIAWLGSGNLAVRRAAFVAIGGFDSTLVTCEDVDLCRRLREDGGQILHDPRMRTIHHGDPATLRALFFGELWRGRDNLRASLRGLTWRDVPSVVIPVIDLVLIGVAAAGLVAAPLGGLWLALFACATVSALSALRAARMVAHMRLPTPWSAAQALTVASVYDVARALALVSGVSHARRRQPVRA